MTDPDNNGHHFPKDTVPEGFTRVTASLTFFSPTTNSWHDVPDTTVVSVIPADKLGQHLYGDIGLKGQADVNGDGTITGLNIDSFNLVAKPHGT